MPNLTASHLRRVGGEILQAAGAQPQEATVVADALVEANLAGIDSHGVMRIPEYVRYLEQNLVTPGAEFRVLGESPAFALIDGGWGFGQVVGRKAMEIAIEKASRVGVGTISVRRCGHLGRVGDYPLLAAERGMATIMFVNTHGGGKLVAPWGGIDRRLSANPISIAIPRSRGSAISVDISTCAIAEGKVRNLVKKKQSLPPDCVIDAEGRPSTNPSDLYGPPPGALLPFGEHKGFALGLVTDILAGALSGAGCSSPDTDRVANGFLAIVLDVQKFRRVDDFQTEVDQFVDYVKSSRLAPGFSEIIFPGEPEFRERDRRTIDGIPVDDETWQEICQTSERYGVMVP
jgi:hydroxycarboxylate dehydrogenase B